MRDYDCRETRLSRLKANHKAAIRVAKENIKALNKEMRALKADIEEQKNLVADVTAKMAAGGYRYDLRDAQYKIELWSKELDAKKAKAANLKADIEYSKARIAECEAEEVIEEIAITAEAQDAAIEAEIENAAVTENSSVEAEVEEDNEMTTEQTKNLLDSATFTVDLSQHTGYSNAAENYYNIVKKTKTFKGAVEAIIKALVEEKFGNRYGNKDTVLSATITNDKGVVLVSYKVDEHLTVTGKRSLEVEPSVQKAFDEIDAKWAARNADTVKKYFSRDVYVESHRFKRLFSEYLAAQKPVTEETPNSGEEPAEVATEKPAENIAKPEIEELEVINPATFDPAPNDKLLKIHGVIFTHSRYTWQDFTNYLEKIAAVDSGADQIEVGEDEAIVEELSDDCTPSEYAVTFEGRLLTSTLKMIKAKVAETSVIDEQHPYNPHYAVLRYDAELFDDFDDDETCESENTPIIAAEAEQPEPFTLNVQEVTEICDGRNFVTFIVTVTGKDASEMQDVYNYLEGYDGETDWQEEDTAITVTFNGLISEPDANKIIEQLSKRNVKVNHEIIKDEPEPAPTPALIENPERLLKVKLTADSPTRATLRALLTLLRTADGTSGQRVKINEADWLAGAIHGDAIPLKFAGKITNKLYNTISKFAADTGITICGTVDGKCVEGTKFTLPEDAEFVAAIELAEKYHAAFKIALDNYKPIAARFAEVANELEVIEFNKRQQKAIDVARYEEVKALKKKVGDECHKANIELSNARQKMNDADEKLAELVARKVA